jgi:hypothetical protein
MWKRSLVSFCGLIGFPSAGDERSRTFGAKLGSIRVFNSALRAFHDENSSSVKIKKRIPIPPQKSNGIRHLKLLGSSPKELAGY